MVAVKNRHKLAAAGGAQRVVNVARLGVLVTGAGEVVDAHALGKGAKLRPPAVIQQINIELFTRPVEAKRSVDRRLHHAERLVPGWHQQIDRGPAADIFRH